MGGHHCCSKHKVKRGLWSPEEDEKLFNYITTHGHACWSTVPKDAGLQRCGKSCRLRWMNYLKPDLKRGSFSVEEERIIIDVHRILGNRWAQIAKHLPGRTDNEVKNFWNSCIKKKLIAQGLDPKTHNLMAASRPSSTTYCGAPAAAGNNSDDLFQSPTTTPFTISAPNKGFDRAKGFDKMAIPPALMAPPQSNVALRESTALSDLQCRDDHVLMSFTNASSSSPSLGHMNAAASSSSFINDQTGNFMDDCVWDGSDMEQHFEALNQIEVGDEAVQVQTTLGAADEKGSSMMEAYCGFDLEMMDNSLLPCGDFYSGGGGGGSMEQLQWHC